MDDKDFVSGEYGNPSVFNDSEDSDIILKCGTKCFYAHRAILRLWSPFFARSLKSHFPIAKSAVFEIDEDDSAAHEPFCTVLKHMYGMPFGDHPENGHNHHMNSLSSLIEDSSLLDADLTAQLLSDLGAEIKHLKKRKRNI